MESEEFKKLKNYFRKQQQPQKRVIISEDLEKVRQSHKKEMEFKIGKLQKEINELKQISDAIN